MATQERLELDDDGRAFAKALGAVTTAARSQGATSRAIIDPISRDRRQALAAAHLCADAGVLQKAEERATWLPLVVPLRGWDY